MRMSIYMYHLPLSPEKNIYIFWQQDIFWPRPNNLFRMLFTHVPFQRQCVAMQ